MDGKLVKLLILTGRDTLRDTCIYMIYPSVEIHLEICFSLCKLAIIKLDYKYSFTKIIIDSVHIS